jgi:tRNA threonylcarbamoyladenosine biosynthesis protein TsaE
MDENKLAFTYTAEREEDTFVLAGAIAEWVKAGAVIALDGDLGAGKTTFSKAFAKALGVEQVVNSPTFTIIKEYEGKLPFYHMDVYRISSEEADELGLDDYFFGSGVTLVEWASRIVELLPEERITLFIEATGEQQRNFSIEPRGSFYIEGCKLLQKNGVIV